MLKRILIGALLLGASTHAAWALRCGNALVVEGDYKIDVYRKCGEPYFQESRLEYRAIRLRQPGIGHPYYPGLEQEQWIPVYLEEWTYNFGPSRFMQVLLFENSRLIRIRSLGYGD